MSDFMLALPGILFWVVLFVVIKSTRKSRVEAPKNAAQKKLVDDVIATIQRTAPDFDGAYVGFSSSEENSSVTFLSLGGKRFVYNYTAHGYSVSREMALRLAAAIAKHFGGEYREVYSRTDSICGYKVISPRQLAEEREEKRRRDSLKHL